MSEIRIQVAVVYHSGYGHTAKQAEAVAAGARSVAGVDVQLVAVEGGDAPWEALERADAIIFGAPTYMGGPSAQFKAFLDATSQTV
ncbi:MAG: NADPH-dependent FMN reductase, partial [Delftia acidovorans]